MQDTDVQLIDPQSKLWPGEEEVAVQCDTMLRNRVRAYGGDCGELC